MNLFATLGSDQLIPQGQQRRPISLSPLAPPFIACAEFLTWWRLARGTHDVSVRATVPTEAEGSATNNRLKVGFVRCFGRALPQRGVLVTSLHLGAQVAR